MSISIQAKLSAPPQCWIIHAFTGIFNIRLRIGTVGGLLFKTTTYILISETPKNLEEVSNDDTSKLKCTPKITSDSDEYTSSVYKMAW